MAAKKKKIRISTEESARLRKLINQLSKFRTKMIHLESRLKDRLKEIHPSYRASARNLVHYIAFRRHEIRRIQKQLVVLGLSSLGRSESAVMANLNEVIKALHFLATIPMKESLKYDVPVKIDEGRHLLQYHTQTLLGQRPHRRFVRVMVTMPTEAAYDKSLVKKLLDQGMDCMRINCAHDSRPEWEKMLKNLREASKETGKKCPVLMDLTGPKFRTGPIEPGPKVIKWRPQRDALGRVLQPAKILLVPAGSNAAEHVTDAVLTLPQRWVANLRTGDLIKFTDARGASRSIKIAKELGHCRLGECSRTAYISCGTVLHASNQSRRARSSKIQSQAMVEELPSLKQSIVLKSGDTLVLTCSPEPGKPARLSLKGKVLKPASIGCTLPEAISHARPGEHIWFDDGKIGGVIESVSPEQIKVKITWARPLGEKLNAGKGINLPDSTMRISALTDKDKADLEFVAKHADLVGLSFARSVADVRALQDNLVRLGGKNLGIVVKIETRKAFEMLPELILAAMRNPAAGIMIARGDLAVECGYERLAEVQEEILWICEAAHIPVIWATQVLETLAKDGLPSRAEITDAAMSERAECVMLNKGPHILQAIRLLDGILRRMEAHQNKKRAMLRRLHWWARIQKRIMNW
jgi:pyruvate kinase